MASDTEVEECMLGWGTFGVSSTPKLKGKP